MQYHIDKTHPRVLEVDPIYGHATYKRHSICCSRMGNHCCSREYRKSEFAHYGPGVVIYFQFVKYMIWVAVALTILSIPQFIFYYSGNVMSK